MSKAAPPHFTDEQRLAFGRVAALYDRARPSYPAAAIDALVSYGHLTAGARVAEVGAGTGKATELLVARGLQVTAIEPSAEMAELARAKLPGDAVTVVECAFEAWRPAARYDAVVSVQAWHWLQPTTRYARARDALEQGGMLAAVWSLPDWERCAHRDALSRVYDETASGLVADFPMHPDSEPTRLAGDWSSEIAASSGFAGSEVHLIRSSQRYTAGAYTDLLQTHQDHILLGEESRAALLAAIAGSIELAGGSFELPFTTHVCLARAVQARTPH